MAEYYLNAQGSETYPFDTAEKGVTDLTRLYHYLDNSNSTFVDIDFTNLSSTIQVKPDHIAPFPKGAEKVVFKTTIQEHEIIPIYMGVVHGSPNYRLPSGCILGTQYISLGVWSFKTETIWNFSMSSVTYNRFIRKGTVDIKAFPEPSELQILDRVMDYYWVVDKYFVDMYVLPSGEELDLEAEPMWRDNHGQNTWSTFFNNSYQKYASCLVGSIADGRTHIYSMSNWSLNIPAVALTSNDKIYVVGDIEEQAGLWYPDYLEYNNSFKDALLTSNDENIKSKFTINDSSYYYNNLSIDNLDLYTTSSPYIANSKRISNCNFHDFSWCGIYFDDRLSNTEGEVTAEIYGNTFDNSMIFDSEGHYNLNIYNNSFTNEAMVYLDGSLGKHNIYNNVFTNNSYIDLENRYEQSMADCVICNNTFSNLEDGYDAIYIVWRDTYGTTMSLKLFNNIVDSGDIYISLTAANPANILNFLHSNNCCPIYDYMLNGAAVAPNENEISEDPLFDVENLVSPLMLLESSPCYGTGLLEPETPELDFLGAKRKTEPGPDMGAFETVEAETPTSPRWGKASDYLIQQYKDGESLPAVVDLNNDRLMALADIVQNIPLVSLGISMAEGVQLDNIGQTVDAGRGSLTDVQYRDWILYFQGINASGGEPDVILGYIRKVLGDSIANILFDEGNAAVNIQLTTQGVVPASTIETLVLELGRIVPAGVEVRLFHSEDGYVFAVADEGAETTLGYGFSEEGNEPPTGRTTGGMFIDPIRVGG